MNYSFILVAVAATLGCLHAQTPPASMCLNQVAGTIFPDYTDCTRFYQCTGGSGAPARGTCGPNLYFNAATGQCVTAALANCFRCPLNAQFNDQRVPRSCTQFIRCIDNVAQHLECAAGLWFDQRLETCNLQQVSSCLDVRCPAVDDPNNNLWARDPNNCGVFFLCYRGTTIRRECPANLHFNMQTRQCDHTFNVNCFN